MTRKHFKAAADIVRRFRYMFGPESATALTGMFIEWFTHENSRFSPCKFRAACEGDPSDE